MPATYEKIATTTLGSINTTITFNSIPSTYTDLRLIIVWKGNTGSPYINFTFNNDTSSLYSCTELQGSGTAATSSRTTGQPNIPLNDWGAPNTTIPALGIIDMFSYAGSTFKTCLIESSTDLNGSGYVERKVGLYRSTTAISRIDLTSTQNYAVGTTATLYGILKA